MMSYMVDGEKVAECDFCERDESEGIGQVKAFGKAGICPLCLRELWALLKGALL